jgi:hypothetical protein
LQLIQLCSFYFPVARIAESTLNTNMRSPFIAILTDPV